MDLLSAEFLAGCIAGASSGVALTYWLIAKGKALASKAQPRAAGGSFVALPTASLFGMSNAAPMSIVDQARPILDAKDFER